MNRSGKRISFPIVFCYPKNNNKKTEERKSIDKMLHTAKRGLFNKPNLVDNNTARAGFSFAGCRRSTFTKQLLLLLLCCFLLSVLFCIWFWQIYHKYYFWIFQSFCIVCVVVVCFLSLLLSAPVFFITLFSNPYYRESLAMNCGEILFAIHVCLSTFRFTFFKKRNNNTRTASS